MTLPPSSPQALAESLNAQPWLMQPFMLAQEFLGVMQALWPSQLLTPKQCALPVAAAVGAPASERASEIAAIANAFPERALYSIGFFFWLRIRGSASPREFTPSLYFDKAEKDGSAVRASVIPNRSCWRRQAGPGAPHPRGIARAGPQRRVSRLENSPGCDEQTIGRVKLRHYL